MEDINDDAGNVPKHWQKCWKAYKTTQKMLYDRGYRVFEEDMNIDIMKWYNEKLCKPETING